MRTRTDRVAVEHATGARIGELPDPTPLALDAAHHGDISAIVEPAPTAIDPGEAAAVALTLACEIAPTPGREEVFGDPSGALDALAGKRKARRQAA